MKRILAALNTQLNSNIGIAVAWENKEYKPVIGTPFCRSSFFPVEPLPSAISPTATNDYFGSYLISLFYPRDSGNGAAIAKADEIKEDFKRGTDLTYSGVVVRCKSVVIEPALIEPDWYHLPVNVRWFCNLPN